MVLQADLPGRNFIRRNPADDLKSDAESFSGIFVQLEGTGIYCDRRIIHQDLPPVLPLSLPAGRGLQFV